MARYRSASMSTPLHHRESGQRFGGRVTPCEEMAIDGRTLDLSAGKDQMTLHSTPGFEGRIRWSLWRQLGVIMCFKLLLQESLMCSRRRVMCDC